MPAPGTPRAATRRSPRRPRTARPGSRGDAGSRAHGAGRSARGATRGATASPPPGLAISERYRYGISESDPVEAEVAESKATQRSGRAARLLSKAVQGLPERDQRVILEHLFETSFPPPAAEGPPSAPASGHGARRLSGGQREAIARALREGRVEEALKGLEAGRWPPPVDPAGTATFHPAGPGTAQQMIPVRLTEEQYRRLKEWCAAHDFPMAVVVRGLVERFLDDQERRAA